MSRLYIKIDHDDKILTLNEYGNDKIFWVPIIQDLEKWQKALVKVTRNFVTIYDIEQDVLLEI
jgi:hypothetical protein